MSPQEAAELATKRTLIAQRSEFGLALYLLELPDGTKLPFTEELSPEHPHHRYMCVAGRIRSGGYQRYLSVEDAYLELVKLGLEDAALWLDWCTEIGQHVSESAFRRFEALPSRFRWEKAGEQDALGV